MDAFVNERDFELLAQDRYTFAVLDRILRGDCELVRSDHQGMILCHSEASYPVWVWTRENCTEAELEKAWELTASCRPIEAGFRYNVRHELAEYFIRRAHQAGKNLGISMQLFAYDCPEPKAPVHAADGKMHCCTPDDLREAAALHAGFYTEIGETVPPLERRIEKTQAYIDDHAFFFWKNAAGKTVACCSYRVNQGLASIGSVYTLPGERRKHYAQNLVYQVTKLLRDAGYMPMLYTDAGYEASNACYESIGYTLRGRLCTITLNLKG